ncbi:hypothetical protein [Methylobacterium sp. WSM2598]|uniref:hypothetical protein n=1 Tax=Methylobacterium sp. WSM2598 TaxID=398261 RepID=UPI00037180B3|nr:hypothetical protein [Methylobacterium sp. WSM2598]
MPNSARTTPDNPNLHDLRTAVETVGYDIRCLLDRGDFRMPVNEVESFIKRCFEVTARKHGISEETLRTAYAAFRH